MAEKKASAISGRHFGWLIGAAVSVAISMVAFWFGDQQASRTNGSGASIAVNAIELIGIAVDPVHGGIPDFKRLEATAKVVDDGIKSTGDSSLRDTWKPVSDSIRTILSNEDGFKRAADSAAQIAGAIPGISSSYEQIADRLGTHNAPAGQIFLAAGQLIRLERIQDLATHVIGSGRDAQASIDSIRKESDIFLRNNRALIEPQSGLDYTPLKDPQIETLAKKVIADFTPITTAAEALARDGAAVDKIQQASAVANTQGMAMATAAGQAAVPGAGNRNSTIRLIGYGAELLGLLLIIVFFFDLQSSLSQNDRAAEERDARQQQSVLSLLDEITNLANGDLTVDVTVSEDFTGAIADSINYTVQTLRTLVGTINDTSAEVVAAAASTQNIARQMNEASERQAREIAAVTNTVTASAQHLHEVSGRADKLASQAQASVQVAHDGAGTVGRTIQNMAALREQIQDTAKRIKRLGESSQEIGNITELINDIAEQTNTLALNASIQAATAGEAGRGFAVVADEVQRLAERAASATRQIETLVKTIQADTAEAIISMERSTANVVAGAKSAEEGGQALTQIESTSQEIARLIQEISGAARAQSQEATKIAGTMQGIREIAVQTSGSAERTSQAVGELNTLSDKLRESVAGFKLPADMAV